ATPVGMLAAEQRLTAALECLKEELLHNLGLPFPKILGSTARALRDCHRFRVLQGEDLIQLAQDVTSIVFSHLYFYMEFSHEPALFPEGPE
ncbi:hypothetical protein, partial [Klebsiella pneumoniae]|uniref:hypothetical protein n=1 Tax=Klebsiella pneumoniae TaxID=573 RepID=UPI00133014F8